MREKLQKNSEKIRKNETEFDDIQYQLKKRFLEDPSLTLANIDEYRQYFILTQSTAIEFSTKVRFLHVKKFVYQKDVKISYKLKSLFSAMHSVKATIIYKIVSDGKAFDIYIGVKDKKVTEKAEVLKGSLEGNFPGTSFVNNEFLTNENAAALNKSIFDDKDIKEITVVVGTPSLKDKEEEQFIQGIENLVMGMMNKPFSAIFIAEPILPQIVEKSIDLYEQIYSVLSQDKEFIKSEGKNSSESNSTSNSISFTEGSNESLSKTKSPWLLPKLINMVIGSTSKTTSSGTNNSSTHSDGTSQNSTLGINSSRQYTFTNKKVSNFLESLEKQIERLEQGKSQGFWNVGTYFLSTEPKNSIIAANIYNGVIKGNESHFETSTVKTFDYSAKDTRDAVKKYLQLYEIPRLQNDAFLAQAITTDELTVQINFPHKSIVGLDIVEIFPFGNNPEVHASNSIKIGKLYNYSKALKNDIALDYNKFTGHIFITGSTGSGKSNVTYNLLDKLHNKKIPFLVIEPAKGEYKDEFGNRKDVQVFGTNENYTPLLKINPFEFPKEIHIYEHIDRFIEILNACWPMEAAMPNLLKEAVEDAYIKKNWLLDKSICISSSIEYPTFKDLLPSLESVINRSQFSQELKGNYEGALVSRVRSLTNGINKLIFTADNISDEDLFDKNTIIDLSRVASTETKALFMGLIFMKLNEYRIANKIENNSKLKHVTVLEEAHNLLKKTSASQDQGSSNLAGKSVEMISNSIAEMRTYGEGFIIADQAPGLLDLSVIRNTNTKICLRLPDFEDRKLVGNAMNLKEEQIQELANLETGVAAIYQNDWQEAILCKFAKFENGDIDDFDYKKKESKIISAEILNLIKNYNTKRQISLFEEKKVNKFIYFEEINDYISYQLLNERANKIKNIVTLIVKKYFKNSKAEILSVMEYIILKSSLSIEIKQKIITKND